MRQCGAPAKPRQCCYALFNIADLLLRVLGWVIIGQVILSWLVAFNVLNTSSQRRPRRSSARSTGSPTPLYRPIRKILPDFGGIDFSPLGPAPPHPDPADAPQRARGRTWPIRRHDREADRRKSRCRRCCGRASRQAPRSSRSSTGRAARPRHRAGRRRPGERRLCPVEGQGDRRGGNGELRAQAARHDAARPSCSTWSTGSIADDSGRRHPRPASASEADRFQPGDRRDRSRPRTSTASIRSMPAGWRSGLDSASSPARRSAASTCSSRSSADLAGKDAVVIGRSNIVGKPMALLLLGESATVTIAHSQHPRPARRGSPRRHRRRRGRPPGNGQGRLDQARRDGDRRRHQPHPGRRRQVAGWSATSTSPRRSRGRRRDHAGARRRRAR